MKPLKQELYNACLRSAEGRISALESAIKDIQSSANEETKSSAGDKYETGRAMAQLEIDKHRAQLAEAVKARQELLHIPVEEDSDFVKSGSLVFTSRGNFYIATHAGQHQIDGQIFFTVSVASPIAQKLTGLKVGDQAILNTNKFIILEIR